jgi:hypothetical protein
MNGMGKYSRDKGRRGEYWLRDQLRNRGWKAERGQQRSGSPDSPDVKCPELPVQWEMKYGYQRLAIRPTMDKLRSETDPGDIPILVWRQERETPEQALATLPLADLLDLLGWTTYGT